MQKAVDKLFFFWRVRI